MADKSSYVKIALGGSNRDNTNNQAPLPSTARPPHHPGAHAPPAGCVAGPGASPPPAGGSNFHTRVDNSSFSVSDDRLRARHHIQRIVTRQQVNNMEHHDMHSASQQQTHPYMFRGFNDTSLVGHEAAPRASYLVQDLTYQEDIFDAPPVFRDTRRYTFTSTGCDDSMYAHPQNPQSYSLSGAPNGSHHNMGFIARQAQQTEIRHTREDKDDIPDLTAHNCSTQHVRRAMTIGHRDDTESEEYQEPWESHKRQGPHEPVGSNGDHSAEHAPTPKSSFDPNASRYQKGEELHPDFEMGPTFKHDKNYTSPCPLLDSIDQDHLPPSCGAIIVERVEPQPKYSHKKLPGGVTMKGPQGGRLRDLGPNFPDQISSDPKDIWKVAVLLREHPWAGTSDCWHRMIAPLRNSALTNRLDAFYRDNGGNFSILPNNQTKTPKSQLIKLQKVSKRQMNRNACWELDPSNPNMMRQNKNAQWYPVPWPAADFIDRNERLRICYTTRCELREKAAVHPDLMDPNLWHRLIAATDRGQNRDPEAKAVKTKSKRNKPTRDDEDSESPAPKKARVTQRKPMALPKLRSDSASVIVPPRLCRNRQINRNSQ